eukprot:GGOE01023048.1.p2 GENE.GGOE01023048.1~~GGOE01023048.1.p2  ORF type:complete len:144 (-),score=32.87 GGOE01023048.1:727-1158(-)
MGNKNLREAGTAPSNRKQGGDLFHSSSRNFTDAVIQSIEPPPRSPGIPHAEEEGPMMLMTSPAVGSPFESSARPKLLQEVLSSSEDPRGGTPQHSARGSTINSVDPTDSIALWAIRRWLEGVQQPPGVDPLLHPPAAYSQADD